MEVPAILFMSDHKKDRERVLCVLAAVIDLPFTAGAV